jgi:hypothetical protein
MLRDISTLMARLLVTSAFVLAGLAPPVAAEDRALLVGVSEYRLPIPTIPGVGQDLATIQDVVVSLGFRPASVKVVTGPAATRQGIVDAVSTWLVDGVGPGDRALFYYSGHGTRVKDLDGDEADGLDEALVPADAAKGESGAQNVLRDDELGPLLAKIKARHVVALIDACYSGTLMRALDDEAPPRLVLLEEEAATAPPGGEKAAILDRHHPRPLDTRLVMISAATEAQAARGTVQGGAFTQGLARAVRSALAEKQALTANDLRDAASAFIAETFAKRPQLIHTPTVDGNPRLAAEDLLPGRRPPADDGKTWALLERLTQAAADTLPVAVGQATYRVGQPVTLTVDVPRDGYLNVLSVGAGEDTVVVLFPNRFQPQNAVKAGTRLQIPGPNAIFDLPAELPAGAREQRTLVLAALSAEPLDAFAAGSGRDILRHLSRPAARKLVDAATRAGGHAAGQFILRVRE